MSERAEQFLKVFNRVYHQWFSVPGYNPPLLVTSYQLLVTSYQITKNIK
jgi:hypothetical protein